MIDPQPGVLGSAQAQRGFTLIEVLVSMLIAVIGLLGLVAMQARSQQAELEAYQRAQAVILLTDILDRVNTNRGGATCYAVTTPASGTPYLGTTSGGSHYDPTTFSCPQLATNPTAQALAQVDLTVIDSTLQGAAEALSGGSVGAMIGARACIGFDSTTNSYTVAVAWQGISPTFSPASWGSAPATAQNCAINQYGNDAQRRVVWDTLLVASLTN